MGRGGHPRSCFLLMFAKQQPYTTTWLEMRRQEFVWPHPDDGFANLRPWNRVDYFIQPQRFFAYVELPFTDDDEIFVLHEVFVEGATAVSVHSAERLDAVLALLPRVARADRDGAARAPALPRDALGALLAKYPWLSAEDFRRPSAVAGPRGGGVRRGAIGHVEPDEMDTDPADAVGDWGDAAGDSGGAMDTAPADAAEPGAGDGDRRMPMDEDVAADLLAVRHEVAVAVDFEDWEFFVVRGARRSMGSRAPRSSSGLRWHVRKGSCEQRLVRCLRIPEAENICFLDMAAKAPHNSHNSWLAEGITSSL